jgi:hypothetical protein
MDKLIDELLLEFPKEIEGIDFKTNFICELRLSGSTPLQPFLKNIDHFIKNYMLQNGSTEPYAFKIQYAEGGQFTLDYDQEVPKVEAVFHLNDKMQKLKVLDQMGDGTYVLYDEEYNSLGSMFYDELTGDWTASEPVLEPIKEEVNTLIFGKLTLSNKPYEGCMNAAKK